MADKKTIAIIILGILFIVALLGRISEISDKTTIEKHDAEQEQLGVVSPTTEPTAESTSEPVEEGVPTFKVGLWKVFSKNDKPYLSVRFSTSEDTTIDLMAPDGIPTDTVKYEIIQKPSKMIGETVELEMGETKVIPQSGTYKLIVTQNEKVVLTKDFTFEGPKVAIRWEPHYKYNQESKLVMDYLDVFMRNDGDIPIYLNDPIPRVIAGGEIVGGWKSPKKYAIDPNKEELILSMPAYLWSIQPPQTEERDELTIWIEDTSGQIYKNTIIVNPLEHIT